MQAIVSGGLLSGLVSVSNFIVTPLQGELSNVPFSGHSFQQVNIANKEKYYSIQNPSKDTEDVLLDLQISSESQYWEQGEIFFAEGNVRAFINGATLKADKLEVDQLNKNLVAKGNVVFINGSNYFTASYFQYNLNNKKGKLENVYGVIDIKLIPKDLNLIQSNELNRIVRQQQEESILSEVKLQDGFTLEGSSDPSMKILSSKESQINSINRWRLKADNIRIHKNGWKAKKVSFTNDPFNPAQSRIDSYKVELLEIGEDKENYTLTASKSYLVLEGKLKIPLGNREISKEGLEDWKRFEKWILGIDGNDRDGIFIGRQLSPIKLPLKYTWSLQPQYLIQRSLQEKTNSYPTEGADSNSPKVLSSITAADVFGLESEISGRTLSWDTNFSSNISTFNPNRFANGSRHSVSFSKEFNARKFKGIEANIFGEYRYNLYEIWDNSIDSNDIYTAYGFKLDKKGSLNFDNIKSQYALRVGLGEYHAIENNSDKLINRFRSNLNGRIETNYPIFYFKSKKPVEYIRPSNSPKVITPSFDLNSLITSSNYIYEGGQRQSSIGLGLGPEITLGSLSKKYFDYTNLSILPTVTFKAGNSPFQFDNRKDLITLNVDLSQHIIGPLLIKSINEWNIDSGSDKYGDIIASKVAIMIQRRAYEMGLFYDIENKSGGVSFSLNGFSFKGIPDSF